MSDDASPSNDKQSWIVLNPDGSYTRNISFPSSLPTPDQDSKTPVDVLSKDVPINDINKNGVRIHIPKETVLATTPVQKLPVVVYYHGGGFIITTTSTTLNHDMCDLMAAHVPAVVVSVDYRLAPEHRLPAAYEDGVEALHWLNSNSTIDPWLISFADFNNVYIMGTSAGANLAYHACLRVTKQLHNSNNNDNNLENLKIKGLIMHCPFIGGVERTESEIRLGSGESPGFTLSLSDWMWDLALPVGATRDHEYCNLLMGSGLEGMSRIKDVGWRVMVIGRYQDMMIDRQMEFAKSLKLEGVECRESYRDGDHGPEFLDKSKGKKLWEEISSFIY